jgi:two-component system, OmpR family, response regulator RpaA
MDITNILVIEDDEIVARTIERCLRGSENRIRLAFSGVEGLQAARREVPDLVILDVIMPGMNGYAVCREMRNDSLLSDVPILFLTAKSKDDDKITGFKAGADDYLSKPFNLDELILRIRAILRRTKNQQRNNVNPNNVDASAVENKKESVSQLSVGKFILNTQTFEITLPTTEKIRLTPVQYDLLYHLMSHPGEIFSPSRLLDEVWDYPTDAGSPDLVRVHIKNLRERVEQNPRNPVFIKTIAGYGYTIDTQSNE